MNNIKLTKQHLMMGVSKSGGWNAEQFRILGIQWPPKKGWMKSVIGTEISSKDFRKFLDCKTDRKKDFFDSTPYGSKGGSPNYHGYSAPIRKWDRKDNDEGVEV